MKLKTCKICKEKFRPERQLQSVCSYDCSLEYANKTLKKNATQTKKKYRKALKDFNSKDVTTLKMKAQNAFNRYIRTRDVGNKCISCSSNVEKGDASHFYSVGGHSAVRFNTDNVHLSCYKCNRFAGGNLIPYKVALVEKIGQERFDKLEALSKTTKFYSSEYYNKLIRVFNKKTKALK